MELKPCPFCGGKAMIEESSVRKGYEAVIVCTGCLVNMPTITYDTQEDANNAAIEAWDRRVDNAVD